MLRRASVDLPACGELRGICPAALRPVARFLSRHPAVRSAAKRLLRGEVFDAVLGLLSLGISSIWSPLLSPLPVLRGRVRVGEFGVQALACFAEDKLKLELQAAPTPTLPQSTGGGGKRSESVNTVGAETDDIEHDFLCGIMARPATRARAADFLHGLATLDFRLRAGLVKTWLHAGLVRPMLRLADMLAAPDGGRYSYPIDAIVSPFGPCNLRCRGCYTLAELDGRTAARERLDYIVSQLAELHVYHVMLVGKGEPFFDSAGRRCLFEVVRKHPRMFFSVYTNGTMIEPADIAQLRRLPNLITLVSLDGPEAINDWRRGAGVHGRIMASFDRVRQAGVVYGFIATVFRQNVDAVVDEAFVREMAGRGCRLGYFSLFVTPPGASDEDCRDMMLDKRERAEYQARFRQLEARSPIPLIDIDAIEAHIGCRAKRGGTVFIDAVTGRVAPCVRAPLAADGCNIYQSAASDRLRQLLASEPFRRYRAQDAGAGECEVFQTVRCQ